MATIQAQYLACVSSLTDLRRELILRVPPRLNEEDVEDELGRLRVWARDTGALAHGPHSLDHRLREAPRLVHALSNNFLRLQENIGGMIALIRGNRIPYEEHPVFDEESTSSSSYESDDSGSGHAIETPELAYRLKFLVNIISNLCRLAKITRGPVIQASLMKGAHFRKKDPDTGTDIFDTFSESDRIFVEDAVADARKLSKSGGVCNESLLVRLSAGVTTRRRILGYRYHQHHHGTEKSITQPKEASDSPQGLPEEFKEGSEDSDSVTSSPTTALDLNGEAVEMPQAPDISAFECPLCFATCPAKYAEASIWRSHMFHDLLAYQCTYIECTDQDQLYSTRRQWLHHEREAHCRRFVCPEHRSRRFDSAAGLATHVDNDHEVALPAASKDQLLEAAGYYEEDERTECPVCDAKFTEKPTLHNHLANHLERFASFALPRDLFPVFDKDQPDNAMNPQAATRTASESGSHSVSRDPLSILSSTMATSRIGSLELPGTKNRSSKQEEDFLNLKTSKSDLASRKDIAALQEAVKHKMRTLGAYHIDTLDTMIDLATAYENEGNLDEAIETYERVFQGELEAMNSDHKSKIQFQAGLAKAYETERGLAEATESYADALRLSEETMGSDDIGSLTLLADLARVCEKQGKVDQAIEIYERVLPRLEETLGTNHQVFLPILASLAKAHASREALMEAIEMYKRALWLSEETIEPDDIGSLTLLADLARVCEKQGEVDQAIEMFERALHGLEETLGANHRVCLPILASLAKAYATRGDFLEATEKYGRALQRYRSVYGPDDPMTLRIVECLGDVYRKQGKLEEAINLFKRVLDEYKSGVFRNPLRRPRHVWRGSHRRRRSIDLHELHDVSIFSVASKLGDIYHDQGRLGQARDMYEDILQVHRGDTRQDGSHELALMIRIARIEREQGLFGSARISYQNAIRLYKARLGSDHPLIVDARAALQDFQTKNSEAVVSGTP